MSMHARLGRFNRTCRRSFCDTKSMRVLHTYVSIAPAGAHSATQSLLKGSMRLRFNRTCRRSFCDAIRSADMPARVSIAPAGAHSATMRVASLAAVRLVSIAPAGAHSATRTTCSTIATNRFNRTCRRSFCDRNCSFPQRERRFNRTCRRSFCDVRTIERKW